LGITTQGGEIRLRVVSGDVSFNEDVTSNDANIYLENATAAQLIYVGYDPGVPGSYVILPGASFDKLKPGTGIVYLGGSTAGDVTIGPADFTGKNIGIITGGNVVGRDAVHLFTAATLGLDAQAGTIGTELLPINTSVDFFNAIANGDIWINETDDVTLSSTTSNTAVTSTTGNFNMVSDGNLEVQQGINAASGTVTLQVTNDLTDSLDNTTRIIADTLVMTVGGNIGTSTPAGRLDTEVNTIQNTTTQNNISIYEQDDILLDNISSTRGFIDLEAGGSIFSTYTAPGDEIYAYLGLALNAGGTIGDRNRPVWFYIDGGDLVVGAGRKTSAGLSIFMFGTTNAYPKNDIPHWAPGLLTDVLKVSKVPPGLIILNGRMWGGENYKTIINGGEADIMDDLFWQTTDPYYNYTHSEQSQWNYNAGFEPTFDPNTVILDYQSLNVGDQLNLDDISGFRYITGMEQDKVTITEDGLVLGSM